MSSDEKRNVHEDEVKPKYLSDEFPLLEEKRGRISCELYHMSETPNARNRGLRPWDSLRIVWAEQLQDDVDYDAEAQGGEASRRCYDCDIPHIGVRERGVGVCTVGELHIGC